MLIWRSRNSRSNWNGRNPGNGERGEIERNFGVGKRRYGLDCIVTKLKETSEVMIHAGVLYMNLRKKLRLLLRLFFQLALGYDSEPAGVDGFSTRLKKAFVQLTLFYSRPENLGVRVIYPIHLFDQLSNEHNYQKHFRQLIMRNGRMSFLGKPFPRNLYPYFYSCWPIFHHIMSFLGMAYKSI